MHGWAISVAVVEFPTIGHATMMWAVAAETQGEALSILAKTPGAEPKPGHTPQVVALLSAQTIARLGLAPGQAIAM